MKQTIFTVFVPMQDQSQCDRMKQLCLDNGLQSFYKNHTMWTLEKIFPHFGFYKGYFGIFDLKGKTQVTEAEFIELLKEYKNGNTN